MSLPVTVESLHLMQEMMKERYEEKLRSFDFYSTPALLDEAAIKAYLGTKSVNVPCVICDDLGYGDTRVNNDHYFKGNELFPVLPFVYVRLMIRGRERFFNLFALSSQEISCSGEILKARFHCFNFFMKNVVPRMAKNTEVKEDRIIEVLKVDPPSVRDAEVIDRETLGMPSWKDRNPLSLSTYEGDYDEIELDHEKYADIIVQNMSDHHIIAPGDGSGLFARICKRRSVSGTFGDLVVRPSTYSSVLQETIESTLERGFNESKGRTCLYVFSYVSHWISKLPEGKCIIIDVPEAHSKFGTIRCSSLVSSTFDLPFCLVVPQDRFRSMSCFRRVPYLGNLMCLHSVRINRLTLNSQVLIRSGNVTVFSLDSNVRDFCSRASIPLCKSYAIEVVDNIIDATDADFYLVPLGRIISISEIDEWNGYSPIRVRTVYKVSFDVVLPESMDVEVVDSTKYCYVADDKKRVLLRNYDDGGSLFSNVICVPLLENFKTERLEIISAHWNYPEARSCGKLLRVRGDDHFCDLESDLRLLHPDYGGFRNLVNSMLASGSDFLTSLRSVIFPILSFDDSERILQYDAIRYADDDPVWSTYGHVLYGIAQEIVDRTISY